MSARYAVCQILEADGVNIVRNRVLGCCTGDSDDDNNVSKFVVMENGAKLPCDALLVAVGRAPGNTLNQLNLDKAGVAWSYRHGVDVNSHLRSKTQQHVFACGDCASAVGGADRRSSHAGWTGFNAIRNMYVPTLLRSRATHPYVPRVTFTDPEVASVGLSHSECVDKYGKGGFQFYRVSEQGTDRGDIDSIQRKPIGFTELRARNNKILGATVCSPAAAEAINEVALALNAGLTCDDMARTLHCYPSYGYPLQRIAIAISLSSVWGLLASCGKVGRLLGVKYWKRNHSKRLRTWQAIGANKMLMVADEGYHGKSFLDVADDHDEFCKLAMLRTNDCQDDNYGDFIAWIDQKPC